MFISKNRVRMHDTDMAGLLYFGNQFRFVNDALEDALNSEGFSLSKLIFEHGVVFAIVHAESDYHCPLKAGDPLDVHFQVNHIGQTSITFGYKIYTQETLAGTASTVHVCLNNKTREKQPIPDHFKTVLSKYQADSKQVTS